jgi:7-carboxy-7-deazaguanine synthase
MKINEIFYSIQGEGIYQGVPMVFVRFQGCNLIPHCIWCDTPYAQDANEGKDMDCLSVSDEVDRLSGYKRNSWVCITGGEPLWQEAALEELVRVLKAESYKVTIETNGSLPVPRWYGIADSWSADIKCPSTGVCGTSKEDWFKTRISDQVKFVVGNKEDLDYASGVIKKHWADSPTVLISPVARLSNTRHDSLANRDVYENWDIEWLQEVVEFCKEENVRFSLQLQKVIWGNKKGV